MTEKEYRIREAARTLELRLPERHGYILLVVPEGAPDVQRVTCSFTMERPDALEMMKRWLIKCGYIKDDEKVDT